VIDNRATSIASQLAGWLMPTAADADADAAAAADPKGTVRPE
jgi:hypothetical protein